MKQSGDFAEDGFGWFVSNGKSTMTGESI